MRHAETRLNVERRYQGHSNAPLTAHGRDQARALILPAASRVFCSDLPRALETAQLAGLAATQDARLRELDFGAMEGKRFDELDEATQRRLLDPDIGGFIAPDGESTVEMVVRLRSFFAELAATPATTPSHHVVVTHGGVLRLLGVVGVPTAGTHPTTLAAILSAL